MREHILPLQQNFGFAFLVNSEENLTERTLKKNIQSQNILQGLFDGFKLLRKVEKYQLSIKMFYAKVVFIFCHRYIIKFVCFLKRT